MTYIHVNEIVCKCTGMEINGGSKNRETEKVRVVCSNGKGLDSALAILRACTPKCFFVRRCAPSAVKPYRVFDTCMGNRPCKKRSGTNKREVGGTERL